MSKSLNKDFLELQRRLKAVMKQLPVLIANDARNFFLDSFKTKSFPGNTTETWPQRKNDGKKRKGAALLVKTGRLRRSIRIKQATWQSVVIGSDVPYAAAHNEGVDGIQQVEQHSRIAKRTVYSRYNKSGQAIKSSRRKVRAGSHQVKAHTRHMRLPRRRFMGNSPVLNQRINRRITAQLLKLNKK